MTAQRQERYGTRPGIAFIALAVAMIGLPGLDWAARAATTERLVVSRYSGLAIEGYDPVAYFTDESAVRGLPDYEAAESGAVWRFRNGSNRDAFVAHPEIYGPRFGGYDPIDLARGVTAGGNPRFWVVSGQRLYLFGLEEHRAAFAADPQRFLRQAEALWAVLQQELAR